MGETIKDMLLRHKKEILALRDICLHPEEEWSDWLMELIAYTYRFPCSGDDIKFCRLCGKIVDRRKSLLKDGPYFHDITRELLR